MKKTDYLKAALKAGCGGNLAWIVSAFCEIREKVDAYKEDPYPYRVVHSAPKYQFVTPDGTLETIEDTSTKVPLFQFKDRISADSTWAENLATPAETCIGNLLFNAVVVIPAFGVKIPFQLGKVTINKINDLITPRLKDLPKPGDPRDASDIYVDELQTFQNRLIFMEQMAHLTNWSVTPKGVTSPPDMKQFRKKLLAEYGERIHIPAVWAEYEGRLKEHDREYLKDDPAFGNFLSGKTLNISRKMMFGAIGMPERLDITDPQVPITRTLMEGQPTDPVEYTAVLNGARFGSYSRGAETVNGGVVSKSVIRIASSYYIDMEDCGTKLGLRKIYNPSNFEQLVGRTLITNTGTIRVENPEQARNYVGKLATIRSPAFCKAGPGDRLCKVCANRALSQFREGLAIPVTEVSQLILTQSLKAMHGKELTTEDVILEEVIS